jgi:hypothetical protein
MFPGTGPARRPVPTVRSGRATPAARTGAMPRCRPPGGCRSGPGRHPDPGCPATTPRAGNGYFIIAASGRDGAYSRAGVGGAEVHPYGGGVSPVLSVRSRVFGTEGGSVRCKRPDRSGRPATLRVNTSRGRPGTGPTAGSGGFGDPAPHFHILGRGGGGDRSAVARSGNSVPPGIDIPATAAASARPFTSAAAATGDRSYDRSGTALHTLPAAGRDASSAARQSCPAAPVPWSSRW